MFLVDGDPRSVEVQWYFCADQAQPAPYTIFASGNWNELPEMPWVGPGEVKGAPREWVNGANLWGTVGDHVCGTAEQFAKGLDHWPTPAEWVWCCSPYFSQPSLCFFPPPKPPPKSQPCICLQPAHFAVPLPHAYGGFVGELEPLPGWVSRPCICLEPGMTARPARHVSPAVRPIVLQSAPCVCLLPGARVELKPGASAKLAGYSAPTRFPVTSSPCVCLMPAVRAAFVAGLSGAGSSSAPTMSAPSSPAVVFSRPCVCLTASVSAKLVPGASGSSARVGSAPSSPAVVFSRPCVCLVPKTGESFRPVVVSSSIPSGSAPSSPPALVSKPCVCLSPGASVGFKRPPGYGSSIPGSGAVSAGPYVSVPCVCLSPGMQEKFVAALYSGGSSSGGGGGGGGGGNVPCNASSLPGTIFFHVSNAGPCNGVYPGPGVPPTAWKYQSTDFGTCHDPLTEPWLVLSCNQPSPWSLTVNGVVFPYTPISVSYHPTFIVFTGVDLSLCGGGTNATVTVEDS